MAVLDIDGVITDGTVSIDQRGIESKRVNFKDIDGIFELKRNGLKIAAITGEDSGIVRYFKNRFPWDFFYKGNKNKEKTIRELIDRTGIPRENVCYVGDGKYDVEALSYVGLGACPADGIDAAKAAADIILFRKSGEGCIWELASLLRDYNSRDETKEGLFFDCADEHVRVFRRLKKDRQWAGLLWELSEQIREILTAQGTICFCGEGAALQEIQYLAELFSSQMGEWPKDRVKVAVNMPEGLSAADRKGMTIGIRKSPFIDDTLAEAIGQAKKNGNITALLTGVFDEPCGLIKADYQIAIPSQKGSRLLEAYIFVINSIAEQIDRQIERQLL